jgi:hypothetical protein
VNQSVLGTCNLIDGVEELELILTFKVTDRFGDMLLDRIEHAGTRSDLATPFPAAGKLLPSKLSSPVKQTSG